MKLPLVEILPVSSSGARHFRGRLFKCFLFFTFFIATLSSFAQSSCIPEKPTRRPFYVHDESNVLSSDQVTYLEQQLQLFDDSTSNQFVIVIVNDLCGDEPQQYATALGQKWGVGQAKKDNGVVILIKPTGGKGERKVFIAVGYGLEAVIPDATAKIIVENEILPSFKQGDIYGGIVNALNVLMPLAKGEFNEKEYRDRSAKGAAGIIFLIVLAVLFFVLFKVFSARSYARMNGTSFWTALWLSSMMGHSGGSWGNFKSGGSDFGGFGGGGFGGGGAGGSW
jgi:uncharacterized protein